MEEAGVWGVGITGPSIVGSRGEALLRKVGGHMPNPYAGELFAEGADGLGYLVKKRVSDLDQFRAVESRDRRGARDHRGGMRKHGAWSSNVPSEDAFSTRLLLPRLAV
jgi:hypothetical protein